MPPHDHLRTENERTLIRRANARARNGEPPPRIPDYPRPQRRSDCAAVPRPCPFAGCRHNLTIDITDRTAAIWYRDGSYAAEPSGLPSCALDVAERGPHTLDQVADMLTLGRARVTQIEERAIEKLRALGVFPETDIEGRLR